MRTRSFIMGLILVFATGPMSPAAASPDEAGAVIAKCAEAMGGADRVAAVRTLRIEVVFPDHGPSPVLLEIRRPNLIRTERAGEYVTIFDGKRGAGLKYDKTDPGQPPVARVMPEGAAAGLETDLIWYIPCFFDFPTESEGLVEANGVKCYKLVTTLPLGTRGEYFVDAQTYVVRTIALNETFQGQTYRMERNLLDLTPVGGILFPARMSYLGRGNKPAVAEIKRIEINPALEEDRFKVPPGDGLL